MAIVAVVIFAQVKLRGAETPQGVAEAYVGAASVGDANRAKWLMPYGMEAAPTVLETHLGHLRGIDPSAVSIDYVPHQTASYLLTARISKRGDLLDEFVLQKFGDRWYLVHFP